MNVVHACCMLLIYSNHLGFEFVALRHETIYVGLRHDNPSHENKFNYTHALNFIRLQQTHQSRIPAYFDTTSHALAVSLKIFMPSSLENSRTSRHLPGCHFLANILCFLRTSLGLSSWLQSKIRRACILLMLVSSATSLLGGILHLLSLFGVCSLGVLLLALLLCSRASSSVVLSTNSIHDHPLPFVLIPRKAAPILQISTLVCAFHQKC